MGDMNAGKIVFDNLTTITDSGMVLEIGRQEFLDLTAYFSALGVLWDLYYFGGREVILK